MPGEFDKLSNIGNVEEYLAGKIALVKFECAVAIDGKDADDASEALGAELHKAVKNILRSETFLTKLRKTLGPRFNEELYLDNL